MGLSTPCGQRSKFCSPLLLPRGGKPRLLQGSPTLVLQSTTSSPGGGPLETPHWRRLSHLEGGGRLPDLSYTEENKNFAAKYKESVISCAQKRGGRNSLLCRALQGPAYGTLR